MTLKNIALTDRERDLILAALRVWQAHMQGDVVIPADRADAIAEIARNGRTGPDASLSFAEIDGVCERLNRPSAATVAHRANARLIAAASDMLAALLAVKKRLDWDDDHDIADSVVDMVSAAIAAAMEEGD